MNTIPGFRDAFLSGAEGLSFLGGFAGGATIPASADDILLMTVGQWRSLVEDARTAVTAINPAQIAQVLALPPAQTGLTQEQINILTPWAQGDFTNITDPLDEAVAAMAPFADSDTLEFALNTLDPSGDSVDQIQQSFDEAVTELADALWDAQNGVFTSPNFAVNLATGAWSTQGTAGAGYAGSTLTEFWDTLGEAAGNAIMSFIGSKDSLLGTLLLEGADSTAFAEAKTVAAQKAADAFEQIQTIGAEIAADREGVDPADISQRARDGIQDLVDGLANVLPGFGGALDSLIFGSRNSDPTFVLALEENIQGSEHGDWFVLSKGADSFDGGLGMDVLFGLAGDDTLTGGADDDVLDGGDDDDLLSGGADNDLVLGGDGNDTVQGDGGADDLRGGAGDDLVEGGADADTLAGDTGSDTLIGGEGADRFVVRPGDETVRITDFELGTDTLDLSDFTRADALTALTDATDGADGAVLTLADGTMVTVAGNGVSAASLGESDLALADLPPNTAPEGEVTITGALLEDETLNADVSGVTDADGIEAGSATFQWQRDGVDIAGATASTYVLGQADVAAGISVTFSYTDDQGASESVSSAVTAPIGNVNDVPIGQPVITGTLAEGETLSADTSAVLDADGISTTVESFQWQRDGVDIAGTTNATYQLVAADIGTAISVVYSFTDDQGTDESVTSAATALIGNVNDPATGAVVVTGNTVEGALLSADVSGVTDADGVDAATETFQWQRDGVDIVGATAATYQLGAADIGAAISVVYGFTDDLGAVESVTSAATAAVANTNDPVMGTVIIAGTVAIEGSTLIADISGVTDADGINATTITYQWQRAGVDIAGATAESYDVTGADVGQDLTVILRYTDDQGTDESVTSAAVTPTALGLNLQGDESPEKLMGGAGDDTIFGAAGDDTLTGSRGDDMLDGGDGIDRADIDGPKSAYTLTLTPTGTTLTDRRADGSGVDTLNSIEYLDFGDSIDTEFPLFNQEGIAGLEAPDLESFIELYIAYFNRAPDAEGLGFWGTVFSNGFSLEEIAGFFIPSAEYAATYPEGQTNADFATAVYNNVLGRLPDQSGFDFWVGALDQGGVEREQFILQVLRGAKVDPEEGATQEFIDQQLADRAYLETKVDIGAYFSVHKGMSDVTDASAAMALYDGSASSVTAAVNAIDGFYADALDADTGAFIVQVVGVLDDPFAMG